MSIGADALLEKEGSKRPGISFVYAIKLPSANASKGLGSGEVDHTFTGVISKTHKKTNYFELDFNENLSGRSGSAGYDDSSGLVGVYERTQSEKNTLHFEIGATFATKSSNADMYTLDYLEHGFSHHVFMRLGGRFGLTPNSPRIGLYAALRFKGNMKGLFK